MIRRDLSGLTYQLTGLEGHRVEVVTDSGKTRRFIVMRTDGVKPHHMEVLTRRSKGGPRASAHYKNVRVLYRVW